MGNVWSITKNAASIGDRLIQIGKSFVSEKQLDLFHGCLAVLDCKETDSKHGTFCGLWCDRCEKCHFHREKWCTRCGLCHCSEIIECEHTQCHVDDIFSCRSCRKHHPVTHKPCDECHILGRIKCSLPGSHCVDCGYCHPVEVEKCMLCNGCHPTSLIHCKTCGACDTMMHHHCDKCGNGKGLIRYDQKYHVRGDKTFFHCDCLGRCLPSKIYALERYPK